MKKVFILLAITSFSFACGNDSSKDVADANSIYACPMHPEVTSNVEGSCHICGMSLEKMSKEEHEALMQE